MTTLPGTQTTVEAVIVDWGGTLCQAIDPELSDMWRLATAQLEEPRQAEVQERLAAVERSSWARAATTLRSTRLMDLLLQAGDELDLDVAGVVLGAARERELSSWATSIRHRSEALPALRAVREAGLKVGMITNTHWPRAFHEQFLEADGLLELIDVRIYTSEIDWVKPHPQAFVTVAERLRVPLGACVHVGDRAIDDVGGATEAGMIAVWLRNDDTPNDDAPGDPEGAYASINSLAELPPVLGLGEEARAS